MKSVEKLPEGYNELFTLDLQKDKKKSIVINGIAIVILLLMGGVAALYVPLSDISVSDGSFLQTTVEIAIVSICIMLYVILHELVHGVAMKMCGTKKVKYGFSGMYAFAGSDDYYYKKPYIFIALAPVVLLGIVLAVLNFILPSALFWHVFIIQIVNISGAAGDIYVTFKFMSLPDDILVKDYGTKMTVYSKN